MGPHAATLSRATGRRLPPAQRGRRLRDPARGVIWASLVALQNKSGYAGWPRQTHTHAPRTQLGAPLQNWSRGAPCGGPPVPVADASHVTVLRRALCARLRRAKRLRSRRGLSFASDAARCAASLVERHLADSGQKASILLSQPAPISPRALAKRRAQRWGEPYPEARPEGNGSCCLPNANRQIRSGKLRRAISRLLPRRNCSRRYYSHTKRDQAAPSAASRMLATGRAGAAARAWRGLTVRRSLG